MSGRSPLVPASVEGRLRPFGPRGVAVGAHTFLLLIVGLAWLIPTFADPRFVVALFGWNGLVFAAWLIDLRHLPRPGQIGVRRTWLAPLALSVSSEVELTISNESDVPISARVLDALPHTLRATPPECRLAVRARSDGRIRYDVRPATRGDAGVGPVFLRYQGPFRLAERWARADLSQPIVTYPNLAEAKRYSVYLIRSRQIELEKRSKQVRGMGRAFESLREYRDGDESRDICWTASARRGKLVTRLSATERNQAIWLLLDSGRLMRARVAGLSKLDHAVNAALALAQVALNSGDSVGVLAYGRRIAERLPAGRGSAHLRRLLDYLAAVREDEAEADHLLAASRVLTDQKRRGLIVWITDLAETAMTPDVVRAAIHLMRRHVVLFVVIGEPDLRALADRRPATVDEMYETTAAQEVVARRELLLARLREGGALAVETGASGLSLAVVNGYLDIKQRNRL